MMNKLATKEAKSSDSITQENISVFQEHVILIEGSHFQVNLDLWQEEGEPASNNPIWREYKRGELISALQANQMSRKEANTLISLVHSHTKTRVVAPENEKNTLPLRPAGFQMINGIPWFIRQETKPIEPKKGNPEVILREICRMFGDEAPLFIGWLKGAYTRQINFAAEARGQQAPYKKVASQTLAIVGDPGTGKTNILLNLIIAGLLGDYANMPETWLNGSSRFNDWALSSNIWVADDGVVLQSIKERKQAATILKQAGYSSKLTIECKNKAVINLDYPCERIFIVNLQDYALRALPAYEENADKFLFLHNCAPSGLIPEWKGDFDAMSKAMQEAIPAFAHWLMNDYVLPEWAVKGTYRHTVADFGYMSPAVLGAISEQDEAGILLARLRKCYLHPEIERSVKNVFCTQEKLRSYMEAIERRADCSSTTKMGTLLRECARRWPHLIEERISNGYREFSLKDTIAWQNPISMATTLNAIAKPDPELLKAAGLPSDFNPCITTTQHEADYTLNLVA